MHTDSNLPTNNKLFNTLKSLLLATPIVLAACAGGGGGGGSQQQPNGPQGLGFDPGKYEDYAANKNKGGDLGRFGNGNLPAKFDMRDTHAFPVVGNQGANGSCVGFASAYGMKTIQEAKEEGHKPDAATRIFSPAFVYNQIIANKQNCGSGSQPKDAMDLLVQKGCATLATMPYSDKDCLTQPTQAATEEASKFRSKRAIQLQTNAASIKAAIASGKPVVIGVFLYKAFNQAMAADGWQYGPKHVVKGQFSGGHAMCAVGYDDAKNHFIVLNSWGPSWGDNGYCYIHYDLLKTPMPEDPKWNVFAMAHTVEDGPNAGKKQADHPTNLTASTDNPNFIQLRWTAAKGIKEYLIMRHDGTEFRGIKTVRETYANDDPGNEDEHRYVVVGIKGKDQKTGDLLTTGRSNEATGRRSKAASGDYPKNLSATTDLPHEVKLRWSPLQGARRYLVVRSLLAKKGPYDIVDYTAATSTFDLPPVMGRLYHYRVAAITDNGPTKFAPSVQGKTSSKMPLDLSSDEFMFPFDRNTGRPLQMRPNTNHSWPYLVATNWSQADVSSDNHLIMIGLIRRRGTGYERYYVNLYVVDYPQAGFPADTTVFGQDLPFPFSGNDRLSQQPIPKGTYYWFMETQLVEWQGKKLVIHEDAEPGDNIFYIGEPVKVGP